MLPLSLALIATLNTNAVIVTPSSIPSSTTTPVVLKNPPGKGSVLTFNRAVDEKVPLSVIFEICGAGRTDHLLHMKDDNYCGASDTIVPEYPGIKTVNQLPPTRILGQVRFFATFPLIITKPVQVVLQKPFSEFSVTQVFACPIQYECDVRLKISPTGAFIWKKLIGGEVLLLNPGDAVWLQPAIPKTVAGYPKCEGSKDGCNPKS
jgi:hypothetical protein